MVLYQTRMKIKKNLKIPVIFFCALIKHYIHQVGIRKSQFNLNQLRKSQMFGISTAKQLFLECNESFLLLYGRSYETFQIRNYYISELINKLMIFLSKSAA